VKVHSVTVICVDDRGMDSLLAVLGYPEEDQMDKWDWKTFRPEAEAFLFEEECYDLERELSGERLRNQPFENMRVEYEDDLQDEWLDYLNREEEE